MKKVCAWAVALGMLAVAGHALAEKPDWEDEGHGKGHGKKHRQEERAPAMEVQIGGYFGDQQRRAASEYYEEQGRRGNCPPGLAKKHNGCQPPGQAKKWQVGRPLERDVVFYPVPPEVVVRIGVPPAGYRYVRVLNDVLLVAIGSNMVVDAIQDLMR